MFRSHESITDELKARRGHDPSAPNRSRARALAVALIAASAACSSPQRARSQRAVLAPTASRATATSAPPSCPPVVATAPEGGVTETIGGARVEDPFRWLEDRGSPRTRAWLAAEDAHTREKLRESPLRAAVVGELQRVLDERRWGSMPMLRSGKYVYRRRDAGRERGAFFEYDPATRHETLVLDLDVVEPPVKLTTVSDDGSTLALMVSKNGSDMLTARVFDIRGRRWLADEVPGFRYSYAAWAPDAKGFYYTRSPTDEVLDADARAARSDVRFHVLGTDATRDRLVRPATGLPGFFEFPSVSDDGRWLIVGRVHSTPDNAYYFLDRKKEAKGAWTRLTPPDTSARYGVQTVKGGFIVSTDEGAPRRRAFLVDPAHPERDRWRETVAERPDATLADVEAMGDYVVYEYVRDAETEYQVRRADGSLVKTLTPPARGTLVSLASNATSSEASIAFATYTDPYRIYTLKPPAFELTPFPPAFDGALDDRYVTEKIFYTSPDGTRAPIFVVRAKSTPPGAPAPLILHGYGAFGLNTSPLYRKGLGVWLDRGGVYAEAVIRGGSEYGKEWHDGGRGIHRKNVYDDFLAAAAHLVHEKWTAPDRLVIRGASAGGLLVTVAETERPDLFRGVISEVPLSDMVRYTRGRDNGPLWVGEYGSPEVPAELEQLLRYSPYHRVKKGVHYPSTLVLGSDDDDRVDPMHARKLVAALQAADPCGAHLLRSEHDAGHGGPTRESAWIQEEADAYTFALTAIGYTGK